MRERRRKVRGRFEWLYRIRVQPRAIIKPAWVQQLAAAPMGSGMLQRMAGPLVLQTGVPVPLGRMQQLAAAWMGSGAMQRMAGLLVHVLGATGL